MKKKIIIEHYLNSMDKYREDPNAQNRDQLLEAEDELRKLVGNKNFFRL